MTTCSIPRRHVLASLVLTFFATSSLSTAPDKRRAVSGLLPHLDAARMIGERYLVLVPEERSVTTLSDGLFGNADTAASGPETLARLQKMIETRRQHDFAVGNTIVLDGWLLARTEARLCALSTLA